MCTKVNNNYFLEATGHQLFEKLTFNSSPISANLKKNLTSVFQSQNVSFYIVLLVMIS